MQPPIITILNIQISMTKSILSLLYGAQADCIQTLSILLVGVGGIGCEVLKCLSKLPIKALHILDLDTIQISNLNRQFLFKPQHRSLSKALTARESILKVNPHLNIIAHHANVKQMEASFFRQFNLVIMALDNAEARSFVNQVCVLLNISMVDAGTSGYNGQVHFIKPRITSCFDCVPKSAQNKVFQVCTIRTRPDKPIHCITWAKFLFEAMFGPYDQGNIVNDMSKLGNELKRQPTLKKINQFMLQVFSKEIKSLMSDKSKPITQISDEQLQSFTQIQLNSLSQSVLNNDQSTIFQINVFKSSLFQLIKTSQVHQFLAFEKDDPIIMSFISAAANLRMHIFQIPTLTFYKIKQTAGNIIPAIASTNSIVAGIQVTQSIKYITSNIDQLRSVYLKTGKQKLSPTRPENPNFECVICSLKFKPVLIQKNFDSLTLKYLIDLITSKRPKLEFSVNMKVGSKDKKELKQIINSADYEDKFYNEEYLGKSIRHFDKDRKIIQVFVMNQDSGNVVFYMYLLDNKSFNSEQKLDLQGFNNKEIVTHEKEMDQEKPQYRMVNGEIILDDSDDEQLCIVEEQPLKSGPAKRNLEQSKLDTQDKMKRIKLD